MIFLLKLSSSVLILPAQDPPRKFGRQTGQLPADVMPFLEITSVCFVCQTMSGPWEAMTSPIQMPQICGGQEPDGKGGNSCARPPTSNTGCLSSRDETGPWEVVAGTVWRESEMSHVRPCLLLTSKLCRVVSSNQLLCNRKWRMQSSRVQQNILF